MNEWKSIFTFHVNNCVCLYSPIHSSVSDTTLNARNMVVSKKTFKRETPPSSILFNDKKKVKEQTNKPNCLGVMLTEEKCGVIQRHS